MGRDVCLNTPYRCPSCQRSWFKAYEAGVGAAGCNSNHLPETMQSMRESMDQLAKTMRESFREALFQAKLSMEFMSAQQELSLHRLFKETWPDKYHHEVVTLSNGTCRSRLLRVGGWQ